MRFQPRLIRQDDSGDSPQLPADLAEMAEQLSADSEHLAARYPAHADSHSAGASDWQLAASDHWPPAAPIDWGRRLLRGAAAAVFLFGIGLGVGQLWRSAGRPARPTGSVATRSVTTGSAAMVRAAQDAHARELAEDGLAAPAGAALPFRSLSGGEQEGVLDPLEDQSSVALGPTTHGSIGPQLKRGIPEQDPNDFDRHIGEVGYNSSAPAARVDIAGDELEMLKIQLFAFEKVIVKLQAELQRRAAEQAETEQLVESLRRQVDSLRKEQSDKPATGDNQN